MPSIPGPLGGMARRRQMAARHLPPGLRSPAGLRSELHRRIDEAFASYGRYWAETLRCRALRRDQILAGITYEGFEHIAAGEAAGRGTILALAASGWLGMGRDAVGADRASHLGRDGSAGATGRVRVVRAFRERLGMRVITTGPGAAAACTRALADNHLLCLSVRPAGQWGGRHRGGVLRREDAAAGRARSPWRCGRAPPSCRAPCTSGRPPMQHVAVVRPPLPLHRQGRLRDDVQMWTQVLASELEVLIAGRRRSGT